MISENDPEAENQGLHTPRRGGQGVKHVPEKVLVGGMVISMFLWG